MAGRIAVYRNDAVQSGIRRLQHRIVRHRIRRNRRSDCRRIAVRHRVDNLCRRNMAGIVAAAATPARTEMVSRDTLLVLRRRKFAGDSRSQSRRCGLLPLYPKTVHRRRDILRRQLQFGIARTEIRRRELVSRFGGSTPDCDSGIRLPAQCEDYPHAEPRGVLRREQRDSGHRGDIVRRRNARRIQPHDTTDSNPERHAVRRRLDEGEHRTEQPFLHPAHRRFRQRERTHGILLRRGGRRDIHAVPLPVSGGGNFPTATS